MSVDSSDSRPTPTDAFLETARLAKQSHRLSFDGTESDIVRLPENAIPELVTRLTQAVQRTIFQIVPVTPQRRSDAFTEVTVRGMAQQDKHVRRLYLVPGGQLADDGLRQRIEEDRSCQVESRVLPVGGAVLGMGSPVTEVEMADVWLIDNRAVVYKDVGTDGPPVWVVSARRHEVDQKIRMYEALWDEPMATSDASALPTDVVGLAEPLLESAPMLFTGARMSCTGNHVGPSCSWYHGIWQYLRLFNMVSSPAWHTDFYSDWLPGLIKESARRRVLITGAADYSTLAFVLAAGRSGSAPGDLDVHVLDQCPTPLNACRWYGDKFGFAVRTHSSDILAETSALVPAVAGDAPYDLIVADAFLTRFSREQVGRVLDNWYALLAPGGSVVTTVRLHPRNGRPSGASRGVADFLQRLRQRALSWRLIMPATLDELLDAARDYAIRMLSNDLGDLDDVAAAAERHRFKVIHNDTNAVSGELVPTTYAQLVLQRPPGDTLRQADENASGEIAVLPYTDHGG